MITLIISVIVLISYLINIQQSGRLNLTNETFVVRIVHIQLFAGSRVDKLSVDVKLSRKRDVHLVDVHLDGVELQFFLTGSSPLNCDDHIDEIAQGRGHEDILVGD